ncbi:MAG: hypothetical protein HOG73_07680 [Candidatus Marinimicrobia bacterium]|jgi:hypothetical protein|nr:hypothetical protein [Candidatus Neomarinimicrobiota bacterium]MBT3937240.1 hypothetical protein [Candidatus Neomarinimicrobiota bacterium]MBT3961497.1 hypothetical protein [Candidatus Neomarinimicrobiota bacterium]MBT4382256.1 hypothetical protein [Candidatus Neomarinimicrobiota bacterium]MBT4635695.1 hypothetical protein [Candidatus Neomarinimicrobiota bacterium]
MNNRSIFTLFSCILFGQILLGQTKLGDSPDGSRSPAVHRIKLMDHDSSAIRMYQELQLPFSTEMTCGTCHDYQTVRSGWHFNAGSNIESGRNGQPWIYANPKTLTQIPLSYRYWNSAIHPDDFGMSPFEFIKIFGRHHPGGSVGEQDERWEKENSFRWNISGKVEVNCLVCHDVNSAADRSHVAKQFKKENFRWASASMSSFADVSGSAKDMPDHYDIYYGLAPDESKALPPQVNYDRIAFNEKDEVFFDVTRNIPNKNCYFCHSTMVVDKERSEFWQHGQDIHLQRGMNCVDCHRNGLDHNMIRGYDNESAEENSPELADFTCAGCHSIDENGSTVSHNNKGPVPTHNGLPPLHLEKLSCTSCHSGEMPKDNSMLAKTSMGHGLGTHGINKADNTLPHIITPVFEENGDGIIEPVNMVWPSYWGWKNGNDISPINRDNYEFIVSDILLTLALNNEGSWPSINESHIKTILDQLSGQRSEGVPVYVSGGKIYFNRTNGLISEENEIANPYTWPIAHNVRPVSMALGRNGCTDCHGVDAPFYTSLISVDSPLKTDNAIMVDFQSQELVAAQLFANAFIFRPWLKGIIYMSVFSVVSLVILFFFHKLQCWLGSSQREEH